MYRSILNNNWPHVRLGQLGQFKFMEIFIQIISRRTINIYRQEIYEALDEHYLKAINGPCQTFKNLRIYTKINFIFSLLEITAFHND